jgi:hypothetical protein
MKLSRYAALVAAALLAVAPHAYAADTKISALPAAAAIGGTEAVPVVQSAATVRTTPASLWTYSLSQLTSANVISKWSGTCSVATFLRGDGACGAVSLTANVSGLLPVTNGGTGQGSLAADNLFMGQGTGAMVANAVPSCSAGTSALTYNTTTHLWGCNSISSGTGTVTSVAPYDAGRAYRRGLARHDLGHARCYHGVVGHRKRYRLGVHHVRVVGRYRAVVWHM